MREELAKMTLPTGEVVIFYAINPQHDYALYAMWSYFLMRWSSGWGRSFPIPPLVECMRADYVVAAMIGDEPVGFGSINRTANNDGSFDSVQWFCGWVVADYMQRKGIGRLIHIACMRFAHAQPLELRATSEEFHLDDVFRKFGWILRAGKETARNEDGQPMNVYTRPPNSLGA
jgi:RimJ/RimL family protein N-acetyltransferase